MKSFPRIIFYGTPEFAVTSLKRLTDSGYHIVSVVTAPDKPSGRGLKEHPSSVKQFAIDHNIPVLQPTNLKDPLFLNQLENLHPDLQIVIAFRMMPKQVWNLPPLGTFNLHASLLPQYRGAAPIHRAIINGEHETGVTTFFLNEQIDAGRILLSEKVTIGPDETTGELHDRLMETGAGLVLRTVEGIVSGQINQTLQDTGVAEFSQLKTAPKILREDCRIDWKQDVEVVYNFIRGMSPHPGAFTELEMPSGEKTVLKIFRTTPERSTTSGVPGTFFSDGKTFLRVEVKNGFLHLDEVQLSGRKTMNCADFLRGFGRLFTK